MADLSIVIVSFNVRPELEACLRSLRDHPPAIPHDIVVVDNASRDGTTDALRERWPHVRLIALDRNVGFAAANNVGIRATANGSDLVLLLNSDTVVPEGSIDRLVARLRAHSDVAVAGPRLVDAHGVAELSFGSMIAPVAELRQKLVGALYARDFTWAVGYVERQASREHFPDWVSGACLLVRRRDAEAVGLLDERYFMYLEDVDFCAAIRGLGRRVLFTPAAEIVHLRGRSRAAAPTATHDAYRRSHVAFYSKHLSLWVPFLRAYQRVRGIK